MLTGDKLIMSKKERQRQVILSEVFSGRRSLKSASESLSISYRQTKRIYRRYRLLGAEGLVHKGRGKASSRAYPPSLKLKIIERYKKDYKDFGPKLFSEYLEEEGIYLSRETLRLWLRSEGLWQSQRKRKGYRQRRERRKRFGELLQIDGSDHAWFGKGYPRSCLLNIVDDATGISLSGLASGETTQILLETLREWVLRYGIPQAVYVDLKSVYISPKSDGYSVFEGVCKELGIGVIKAYSPQAKGRVERSHGTYQDRFVKGLRVAGITDLSEANRYLKEVFIPRYNNLFSKPSLDSQDGHAPIGDCDLDQIFCWKYKRVVKNDRTFQYTGQHYQLLGDRSSCQASPKKRIEVRIHLDGRLSAWYQGKALLFSKIASRPVKPAKAKGVDSVQRSQMAKKNKHRSPWSQFNPGWLKSGRSHTIKKQDKEKKSA